MIVTICIGSSCHIKGSREVVQELERLIDEHGVRGRVELTGSFCLGNCVKGVSVVIDERVYSLKPEECQQFFEENILKEIDER